MVWTEIREPCLYLILQMYVLLGWSYSSSWTFKPTLSFRCLPFLKPYLSSSMVYKVKEPWIYILNWFCVFGSVLLFRLFQVIRAIIWTCNGVWSNAQNICTCAVRHWFTFIIHGLCAEVGKSPVCGGHWWRIMGLQSVLSTINWSFRQ